MLVIASTSPRSLFLLSFLSYKPRFLRLATIWPSRFTVFWRCPSRHSALLLSIIWQQLWQWLSCDLALSLCLSHSLSCRWPRWGWEVKPLFCLLLLITHTSFSCVSPAGNRLPDSNQLTTNHKFGRVDFREKAQKQWPQKKVTVTTEGAEKPMSARGKRLVPGRHNYACLRLNYTGSKHLALWRNYSATTWMPCSLTLIGFIIKLKRRKQQHPQFAKLYASFGQGYRAVVERRTKKGDFCQ